MPFHSQRFTSQVWEILEEYCEKAYIARTKVVNAATETYVLAKAMAGGRHETLDDDEIISAVQMYLDWRRDQRNAEALKGGQQ